MTTRKVKRVLIVAMVLVALVATTFAFTACSGDKNVSNLKNPTDIFALAGVSTGAMLDSMASAKVAMAGEEISIDEEVIAELNKYMSVVESLISSDKETTKLEKSDRPEYAKVQIMKVPDMEGKWTEYKLYYNEDDKVAMDDDEDDEEPETEETEEGEEEYESHITGIMVIGEREFPIKGDIEVEKEADEEEQSIEFKAYLDDTKTNYIVFESETENEVEDGLAENEVEYSYKTYKDNALVDSFKLEVETEQGEEEYSIVTKNADGETKFDLEKEVKGDKTDIVVKYAKNGKTGEFKVETATDADGNTVYKYILSNGDEVEKDRD